MSGVSTCVSLKLALNIFLTLFGLTSCTLQGHHVFFRNVDFACDRWIAGSERQYNKVNGRNLLLLLQSGTKLRLQQAQSVGSELASETNRTILCVTL